MSLRKANDYRSDVKPIWCPGCGNYAIRGALMQVFAELDIPNEDIVLISGIGCSGRFPSFLKTYGIHGIHGRTLPLATGVKLGNPDLTVVAVSGDGDGLGIGGGHIPHAARRNVNITYILSDNSVYGMTKGQTSPTSPANMSGHISAASHERPLNPVVLALSYEASFVARAFAGEPKSMAQIFKEALLHPGFAMIHVISPCVTFYNTYERYRAITTALPAGYDPTDWLEAIRLARATEQVYLGVFYRDYAQPPFDRSLVKSPPALSPQKLEGMVRAYNC